MDTHDVQEALAEIGWPIPVDGFDGPLTVEAIADFQRGYAFTELVQDGLAGPLTQSALTDCLTKDGRCSEHFAYREFRSAGNGWIKVNRVLAASLDAYRREIGGPVRIVSGYRDPAHNAAIGGAANSQHLYGNAADVEQLALQGDVIRLGLFSGIGTVSSSGLVAHVDVREAGPNTTGGTGTAPTLWYY